MQCLIGLGSPGRTGTGFPSGRVVLTCASGRRGVHFRTSAVHAAIGDVNCFRDGKSMMLNVPRSSLPIYCSLDLLGNGCGPFGLAIAMLPLPFATSSWRPSGVTRTDVGYHPTGMKPNERLCPGRSTSKTPTALMLALATKSVFSSGDSAKLFGVAPRGDCGKS